MLTEIFNEYYFTSINYYASFYGENYLYKVNNAGNLIFRKLILPNSANIKQSFKSLDKKLIYVSNVSFKCDINDSAYWRTYLTKIDTNGLQLFNLKIKRVFGTQYYNHDNFKTAL